MVIKSCHLNGSTISSCLYNWYIRRMERTRMKYLDYIKKQIKLLTNKSNIIRFPIERRLQDKDMEDFLDNLANNTPNEKQFDEDKE